MKHSFPFLLISFVAVTASSLLAQAPAQTPDDNPESNAGALKEQIQTAGSYDAHSGNATRIANDLHLPGALGAYGLDFTRYRNSLRPDVNSNPHAVWPEDFGHTGWSYSWRWTANYGDASWQVHEGGGSEGTEFWETSITIGFPDGHFNKYKITRAGSAVPGQPPSGCAGRSGWGAPYLAQCGEQNWPAPGEGVHDRLSDMAEDGSNFWLHLADGGSVHFVGGDGGYEATEVFDPHGFRTDLHYGPDGLDKITQEDGGRWLDIIWDYRAGFPFKVIVRVQSGGYAGVQSVVYNYNPVSNGSATYLVLTSVDYPDDPAPGQTASAIYTYDFVYGDDPNGAQATYPLLKTANDPRYPGAMTKIRYSYRGVGISCPDRPPGTYNPNYFHAVAEAIGGEANAETAITVSSFSINCYNGTRQETSGLGGWRTFYFGGSAGADPGTQGFHCLGYQLAKVTDFTNQGSGNLPFEQQNYMDGQPRQVWDGRGILTELVATPFHATGETGDDSGQPSEIHHTGALDGSAHYYDRINPGLSEARDTSRIHSPGHHWLFSQKDERGLITKYVRDSRMRVKDIVYPVTAEHFTYNDFNQVTSHTLASGAIVTYEYDPTTHRLLREYNSVDGWDARKEYIYDDPVHPDLVHKVIDGRARASGAPYSTRMEYNGRNRVIEVHYAPTGINPDPMVAYGYDAYGNCTSITDELGHTSFYFYDSYRRCTRYIEPLNASDWKGTAMIASRTWDWIYSRWIDGIGERDASAHTKNEWRIQIEPAFNAAGDRKMTARAHDLQNRIVIESTGWIQPAGEIGPNNPWYWSPPDGENHFFGYDENGQKNYFKDPQGRETTYTYDLRNRLRDTIETKRADQSVNPTTTILYDTTSNKTLITFPDGKTQQWLDYDAFGQAWTFIDERSNTTNLTYQWGSMKKLQTVTTHRLKDAGGTEDQLTTFYYDLMGRPQWTIFPDGTSELTTYLFGQVDAFKTRKNQTKRVHYDARGRESYHTWDSDAAPRIDRSWDDANRLSSITNIWSSIDFAYDDAGQVIWEGDEIAGSGGRTQTNYYRYPDGSIAHLHYPGGHYIRHDYTSRGQLAATGWDDDDNNWWKKLATYTFLADGKVGQIDFGNGTRTGYAYDGRGMIQIVDHYQPGVQDISWRQYWRDSRDRITAFQKSYNPGSNPMENGRGDRFAYDWEGQLTDGWYNALDPAGNFNSWTRKDHFSYDALGNRQGGSCNLASRASGQSAVSFTRRNNGLNQYTHWWPAGVDYGVYYDDNLNQDWQFPGNGVTMADGWLVASYNALNQPVAMWSFAYQGTSNYMWFGYDPLGRCVKRWVGDSGDIYSNPATYFHYDGWNLLQEGNNAWGPARVYVHGSGVDDIVWSYNTFTGEQAFHHYDARGHCTLLTDSVGSILEQYEYDAFGQPYFFDASGNAIGSYDLFNQWQGYSAFGNRFLFTGREWLADVRLYDYRNRVYQPELGRFLQPDPKEFAAGDYNLYRYCHNDPVNKSDPAGLDEYGRAIGELVGAYVFGTIGMDAGAAVGALAGFGGGLETGPGEAVTIPAGAAVGGFLGGGVGIATGIRVGGDAGDYVGDRVKEALGNILHSRPGAGSGLPTKAEPDSSQAAGDGKGGGTIRDYGSDGKAKTDYDVGHDHGQGDPHAHDWDHSGPKPVRLPGRPLDPGE